MSDSLKFVLGAIGFLFLGLLGLVLFSAIWLRIGFLAAFLALSLVLLFVAWRMDRRERTLRGE